MILDLIVKCAMQLGEKGRYHQQRAVAQDLAESIAASIPYHVTDNLQIFMKQAENGSDVISPGRPVGGLLLMHSLYVTSRLPVVSSQLRALYERMAGMDRYSHGHWSGYAAFESKHSDRRAASHRMANDLF